MLYFLCPEHGPKGKNTTITAGCTMDLQISFDALSNTLSSAKILREDESWTNTLNTNRPILTITRMDRWCRYCKR